MGSSPGFGSTPRDSWGCPRRPFGLAFAPAPAVSRLSLATRRHSSAHSTKGTPSPGRNAWLRPAGGARFQALFHSPRRGAFHRSLTVLVRYRSPRVFSLGRWSAPLPAGFRVSGGTHARTPPHAPQPSPTGLSPPPVARSSGLRLTCVVGARGRSTPPRPPSYPPTAPPTGSAAVGVWAPPRSLAATRGILSLPPGTEMFQFPGCPPASQQGAGVSPPAGCPIRRPPDRRLPAPPRGVSPRGRVLPRPAAPRHPPCARLCGHPHPAPKPRRARASCPRLHATQHTHTHVLLPHALPHAPRLPATRWPPESRSRRGARGRGASPPGPLPRGSAPPRGWLSRCCSTLRRASRPVPGHPGDRWSRGGSNPEPPPCKGGALPVELRPPATARRRMPHPGFPRGRVGAPGLEPGTSALSGPRSDRLSYAPARWLTASRTRRIRHPPGSPKRPVAEGRQPGRRRSARRGPAEVDAATAAAVPGRAGVARPRARVRPILRRRPAPPPPARPRRSEGRTRARCPAGRLSPRRRLTGAGRRVAA